MKTEFLIVRHGETEANLQGIVQGHLDIPLNETGRTQANASAERLRGVHVDAIYTSDLLRAFETAQIIGKTVHADVFPVRELREWHLGTLEGMHKEDIDRLDPKYLKAFAVEPEENVAVPGGETHDELFRRVQDFLEKLSEKHAGKTILLVTHSGPLRAIFNLVVGRVANGRLLPRTDNASYSKIAKINDSWQLVCWNDVTHLKNVSLRESTTF